jgi:hypothetical protein
MLLLSLEAWIVVFGADGKVVVFFSGRRVCCVWWREVKVAYTSTYYGDGDVIEGSCGGAKGASGRSAQI